MNNLIKQIVESKFNFNIDADNNDIGTLLKSKMNIDSQKESFIKHFGFVDLGLQSKTLWAKYNFGVDLDKINQQKNLMCKDFYGNYYAWGELDTKIFYSSDNSKWDVHPHYIKNVMNNSDKYKNKHKEVYKKYTYYDENIQYLERYEHVGFVEMNLEDDAAYVHNPFKNAGINIKNAGINICIPTREQFRELLRNTISKNVYDYEDVKGLNGKLYTSTENGESLFLPFAGYKTSYRDTENDNEGLYWTSTLTLNSPILSYSFEFDTKTKGKIEERTQYTGFPIRPVLLSGNDHPKFKMEYGSKNVEYYK